MSVTYESYYKTCKWQTYVSLQSYFQCLKCNCSCFLLTERQRLGVELVEACSLADWSKAIRLAENGEWTGAERHREVMFC